MCYGLNFAEVSAKSDLHHFFTVAGNSRSADHSPGRHFSVQIL